MVEGSMLERVARLYHAAQEKSADKHVAMSKYYTAVSQIESLEKEAEGGAGNGGVQASIADELLEQHSVVRQCIEQFEGFEINHALLCTYSKDFLLEQIVQAQLDQVGRVHHRLTSPKSRNKPWDATDHQNNNNSRVKASPSSKLAVTTPTESSPHSVAAEVAAKLTANSSSAAVLTSVLSSLAAEEAHEGVQSPNEGCHIGRPSLEKRPKVESRPAEVISDRSSCSLPPPYLTSSGAPLPYALRPPPPPLQGRVMGNQHSMGMPIPPGCAPAAYYQPFPVSSMQPYYSPPPLPAPPAPAPRQ